MPNSCRRTLALGLALATAARRAAACEVGFYQPGDIPGVVPCEVCTQGRMTWMPLLAIVLSLTFLVKLWHARPQATRRCACD